MSTALAALATLASVGHEIKAIARTVKLAAPRDMFTPTYGGLGGNLSPYAAGLQMLDGGGQTALLDYDAIVGHPLTNGVVARCADARARATADAPLLLEERTSEGWRLQNDHECLGPLRAPNPDHSDADIWGLTELWKSVEAQSFWLVLPNKSGKPGEIYVWNPARVHTLGTSDEMISGYRVQKETGEYAEVDKRLVIHFRHLPNPFNPRLGWNPLGAGRMQIAGDNLSGTYHTAILRNAGVISMLISLKEGVTAGSQVTPEQFEKVLNHIRRATIENAGGVNGLNVPLDIHKMAYSPAEMNIDKLIEYYERRICSVMGVSQRVAGLGADPTYNNLESALKDFWDRTIVPSRNADAATLNRQWLPLWGMDSQKWRFRFDYSNVPALQENKDALHARVREDYKAGALDLKQWRALVGYAGEEEEEEKYNEVFFKGKMEDEPTEPQADAETTEAKIDRIQRQIARAESAQEAF